MSKILDVAEWMLHYIAHHDPDSPCPEGCRICALEEKLEATHAEVEDD